MHTSVFLKEVLEIFNPQPGQIFVDATVNGGGHARAIADRVGKTGRVIGIDLDAHIIEKLKERSAREHRDNLMFVCDNYVNLRKIILERGYDTVNGILFDLGFSSYHIEQSGRGFSFLRDEPLDMRYDPLHNDLTAEKILQTWSREAIENILLLYGEERYARRIAERIMSERAQKKITTSSMLAKIVCDSIPRVSVSKKIHPATRTFQAIRMAVNDELANLEGALREAMDLLLPGGMIIVISFHSLEDRAVKRFLQARAKENLLTIITKKPLKPSHEEIKHNHRARSAKLRAASYR